MKLSLPFTEAIAIATASEPLPTMIQSLRCEGDTVLAEIDLGQIPDASTALRFAAAAAGTISITARFTGFSHGVATLAVTVHARALPAHKLLPMLVGPINNALRDNGLPDGLVTITRGDNEPLVFIDVQKAVASKANGVTVTELRLADAVIHVSADIGTLRLR